MEIRKYLLFESALRNKNEEFIKLLERLKLIPFENSMPGLLTSTMSLSNSVINSYENICMKMIKKIEEKNKTISSFRHAFNHVLSTRPESGYIIDSRDPDKIIIHLYKVNIDLKDKTAMVFRNSDEYIGRAKFFKYKGSIRAKMTEYEAKIVEMQKRISQFKAKVDLLSQDVEKTSDKLKNSKDKYEQTFNSFVSFIDDDIALIDQLL